MEAPKNGARKKAGVQNNTRGKHIELSSTKQRGKGDGYVRGGRLGAKGDVNETECAKRERAQGGEDTNKPSYARDTGSREKESLPVWRAGTEKVRPCKAASYSSETQQQRGDREASHWRSHRGLGSRERSYNGAPSSRSPRPDKKGESTGKKGQR